MNTATVALLGDERRSRALRARLAHAPVHWVDQPDPTSLNLLLDDGDGRWRQQLLATGLPFQVVPTDGQALRALGAALGVALVETDEALLAGRGRWSCESCSDPDCEHRLFRDLLARRG